MNIDCPECGRPHKGSCYPAGYAQAVADAAAVVREASFVSHLPNLRETMAQAIEALGAPKPGRAVERGKI